jgi:hypothetical protein
MDFRSLALLRSWAPRDLVELGAELGFNTIELINGGVSSHLDFRGMADEEGIFELADEFDMDTALWIREFDDYNESWWGEMELDNDYLWTGLRRRYETLCELYPEVDYLVIKTVESHEWITSVDMLERLLTVINDVCREYNTAVVYRGVIWHPEQLADDRELIGRLPNDADVMTKCVGNDWNYRASHHPLIGEVGDHEQYVEIDIETEYHRTDAVANAFTEEIKERFDYWEEQDVNGVHVRPSWSRPREWEDSAEKRDGKPPWAVPTVVGEAQEANLRALGRLTAGEFEGMTEVWEEFAVERFGADAAETMIAALRPTGEVVEEALCVDRETFGDPRRPIPAQMTMFGNTVEKRTDAEAEDIPELFKAYLRGDETPTETTHSFQLSTNPFARNWSTWRWDDDYVPTYHKLRKGHPDIISGKERAQEDALASARRSLELVDEVENNLPEDAYDFFRFKLAENEFMLEAMYEVEMAWLKASNRLYYDEGDVERVASLDDVETHLDTLSELTDRTDESVVCTWLGETHTLERGTYIDIPGYVEEFRRYWQLDA